MDLRYNFFRKRFVMASSTRVRCSASRTIDDLVSILNFFLIFRIVYEPVCESDDSIESFFASALVSFFASTTVTRLIYEASEF